MNSVLLDLLKSSELGRRLLARLHPPNAPHRVSADSIAPFFRRLSAMLAAGVPLVKSMDFLAESEDDADLRRVLQEMLRGLNNGQRLSDTMRAPKMRQVFDPVMLGLIGLGEKTGALHAAIERIADLSESTLKLRKATVAALTYPCVLISVMTLVGLLFVAVLGNKDQGIFALFGVNLPWPTQVIVSLSAALRSKIFWIVLVLGIGIPLYIARRQVQNSPGFRRFMHTGLLHIPVVGTLIKKATSARVLYILSNSISVGVPLLESLRLARVVCTNDNIKESLEQSRYLFAEGLTLSEAFQKTRVFPPLVISMVALGEEAGNLDGILRRVTSIYEEDVESALENATRLVEPLLLGVSGVMASFLALATLLPIIQVVDKL